MVYLSEFPDSETGFVPEAAFQKKTMHYARQKEARKLQVELQKEGVMVGPHFDKDEADPLNEHAGQKMSSKWSTMGLGGVFIKDVNIGRLTVGMGGVFFEEVDNGYG
ncbi:unnamed protein product [Sphagnum balticum]